MSRCGRRAECLAAANNIAGQAYIGRQQTLTFCRFPTGAACSSSVRCTLGIRRPMTYMRFFLSGLVDMVAWPGPAGLGCSLRVNPPTPSIHHLAHPCPLVLGRRLLAARRTYMIPTFSNLARYTSAPHLPVSLVTKLDRTSILAPWPHHLPASCRPALCLPHRRRR